MPRPTVLLVPVLFCATLAAAAQQPRSSRRNRRRSSRRPPAQAPVTNLGNDANGNPLRLAVKTGHISNYDETKVTPYTLPDPLVLANGTAGDGRATRGERQRRPEIMRLYETEIFGRVPATAPKVTWQVTGTEAGAREGDGHDQADRRHDRQRRRRAEDRAHALHAAEREGARADRPPGELRRRAAYPNPRRRRAAAAARRRAPASRRSRRRSSAAAGATRRSSIRTSSPIERRVPTKG